MAKIYKGNLPKTINVVIDKKVYAVAKFDENGIYETEDEKIIKELKDYGYRVDEEKPLEVDEEKPRKKRKELD